MLFSSFGGTNNLTMFGTYNLLEAHTNIKNIISETNYTKVHKLVKTLKIQLKMAGFASIVL